MTWGPKTTIVGGGIIGALCAFRLAEAGAAVTVLEARPRAGSLVTAASFGWINAVHFAPGDDAELFRLRCRSFDAFDALETDLGRPLPAERRGAMLWEANDTETEAAAKFYLEAGGAGQLVGRAEIERRVPGIKAAPELALFNEKEFALDVTALTELLLAAATERGARVLTGLRATAVETESGKVTGLRTGTGLIAAERLVIAAGTESRALLDAFAPEAGITASPAAIVALDGRFAGPSAIADGPRLEFRVQSHERMLSAWSVPEGDDPETALAEKAVARVREMLGDETEPEVAFVRIGQRPYPANGRPLVGPVGAVEGLFAAIVHPGVILGPATAETIRDLVLGREPSSGLRPVTL